MTPGDTHTTTELTLNGPDATTRLAAQLADLAAPGIVILLEGPVGAGKTHLARAVIQTLQARNGPVEDVPSPTFTLVQTYQAGDLEIWHTDLYRLTDVSELIELGLDAAFQSSFCLIEWPDRMGPLPDGQPYLHIQLTNGESDDTRLAMITAQNMALPDFIGAAS